jgi:hypothetical protein
MADLVINVEFNNHMAVIGLTNYFDSALETEVVIKDVFRC